MCENFSDVQVYGDSNQLKRSLSVSDQRGSPFKKRQFSQQTTSPVQSGLLIYLWYIISIFYKIEDDDDDNDDDDSNNGPTN